MKSRLENKLIELGLNEHQIVTILDNTQDYKTLLETLVTKELAIDLVISINSTKLDTQMKQTMAQGKWSVIGISGGYDFAYSVGLHVSHGIELLSTSKVSTDSQCSVLYHIAELIKYGTELPYDEVIELNDYTIVTGYDENGVKQSEKLKVVLVKEGTVDYERHPMYLVERGFPDATPEVVRVYIADELNILPRWE